MSPVDWNEELIQAVEEDDSSFVKRGRQVIIRWADRYLRDTYGPGVYVDAVDVVVAMGPGATLAEETLREIRPPDAIRRCVELLTTPDASQRYLAISLLAQIGGPSEIPAAAKLAADSESMVRDAAVHFVTQLAIQAKATAEQISPMLQALETSPWPEAARQRARLENFLQHDWDALMTRVVQHEDESDGPSVTRCECSATPE